VVFETPSPLSFSDNSMKEQQRIFSFSGDGFRLRTLQEGDAATMARHANNIRIAANLRDVFPHPYGLNDARIFIRGVLSNPSDLVLGIEVDGEVCGAIGLHGMEDIYRYNAEIGYWLSEQHWGRGIMSSAVREVVKIGFTRFHWTRIWAGVFYYNAGSARVLEKNGFRKEAIHYKAVMKNGKALDEYIYAILREEWLHQSETGV